MEALLKEAASWKVPLSNQFVRACKLRNAFFQRNTLGHVAAAKQGTSQCASHVDDCEIKRGKNPLVLPEEKIQKA